MALTDSLPITSEAKKTKRKNSCKELVSESCGQEYVNKMAFFGRRICRTTVLCEAELSVVGAVADWPKARGYVTCCLSVRRPQRDQEENILYWLLL